MAAVNEKTYSKGVCRTISLLLQYFQLSTFFWMAIEGIYLYQKMSKPFRSMSSGDGKGKVLKYCAIGWGKYIHIYEQLGFHSPLPVILANS